MIKRRALFLFVSFTLTFTMLALAASAVAQSTVTVKGVCKDDDGKPIIGATVELANADNGSKITVKTDSHGQYSSIAVPPGSYNITLTSADGKAGASMNNVPVKVGTENVIDFDLAKLRAEAAKQAGAGASAEKVKKDNEKIKNLNALLQQAAQFKKENNYAAAVATMEQAAAQDQSHDIIYASLGDAYLGAKRYPEAEGAYNKAISLAPATSKSLGGYHANLALALMKEGKTDLSLAECDKAAQLDPSTAGLCYFNQGAILTNQGKADEANAAFDKSIAADPNRAEAYYQKGVNLLAKATLGKDGKMVPAPGTAEALNKYLELAPDGKNAQAAKDLLASIGAAVQTTYGNNKKKK